jgi:hypothetical protein
MLQDGLLVIPAGIPFLDGFAARRKDAPGSRQLLPGSLAFNSQFAGILFDLYTNLLLLEKLPSPGAGLSMVA